MSSKEMPESEASDEEINLNNTTQASMSPHESCCFIEAFALCRRVPLPAPIARKRWTPRFSGALHLLLTVNAHRKKAVKRAAAAAKIAT